jgi:hypothetical protein
MTPEGIPEGPETPQGGADPEGAASLGGSLASATERIQLIIDAAEQAAAGIRSEAREQAQRYVQESRQEADRVSRDKISQMAELTDALVEQASRVRQRSNDLIAALDSAARQLAPEASENAAAAITERPSPPRDSDREEPPVPPPAAPRPEAFSAPAPTPTPEQDPPPPPSPPSPPVEPVADPPRAQAANPARPGEGLRPVTAARLLAAQMSVGGSDREEIARRLRDELGIENPEPILDEMLGGESR